MSGTPIRCANCGVETGAVFVDGDPYLPLILCVECAEDHDSEPESTP